MLRDQILSIVPLEISAAEFNSEKSYIASHLSGTLKLSIESYLYPTKTSGMEEL